MQSRHVSTTVAHFLIRFAALTALTVGVLASVSVSASRDEVRGSGGKTTGTAAYVPDSAQAINDRRYPLVYADAAQRR